MQIHRLRQLKCVCLLCDFQGGTFQKQIREYFDKYVALKTIDEYSKSAEGKKVRGVDFI